MVDFSIEPEFQAKLDWIKKFVDEKCMPLDYLFDYEASAPYDWRNKPLRRIVEKLQDEVKAQKLWACHLPPNLGGPGYGAVKLTYINELLGKCFFAPVVFGCQGPDSGNSEILAMYGTPEQKERYLKPLLAGEIFSCFSMTEPQGGSDPTNFTCSAVRDGDHWVINGEKWYSSHANHANFLIIMAVTNPEAERHKRATMFIAPVDSPGVEFAHHIGFFNEAYGVGGHPHMRYTNLRLPDSARLGPVGEGFKVAQSRLGGGRLHHAQRTIGLCQHLLDMMGERALSRYAFGGYISEKQSVQADIANSYIELLQFRLQVLYTAWLFDQGLAEGREGRKAISAVKAAMAKVANDLVLRCLHLHGSIGLSNVMRFGPLLGVALHEGVADGPTEVHVDSVAKAVLRNYKRVEGNYPTEVLWERKAWAAKQLEPYLDPGVTLKDARATL
ncbi:MAG: acyl-CoA dehydrogenase family protein [Gammaproteobacteria bacterium]